MNQSLAYEYPEAIAAAIESAALVSLCTIQQRTNTVDGLGQVDLADWVNVVGLVNLPAMLAPYRPSTPDRNATTRMPESIDTSNYRHVLLNGYYPDVLQQYQAVVDGTAYEIFAVEHDSQKTMTRLVVRLYQQ